VEDDARGIDDAVGPGHKEAAEPRLDIGREVRDVGVVFGQTGARRGDSFTRDVDDEVTRVPLEQGS
jgi:hypothetical protein